MPSKQCRHPTCSGEKCRRTPTVKPKPKPIAKFSNKRKKVNSRYFKEAREFIKDNPLCVIKSEVCTTWAQHPNHPDGRIGENLTDKSKWQPSCNACNAFIEAHDEWARERGFKNSKFTPTK